MMVNQEKQLHFLNAVCINEELWFSALEWNGYYKMNINTGSIKFLGKFEYANFFSNRLFYRILTYQQYIFFVPWFFNYLVRLDTVTLETKYWKVPPEIEKEIAKFRAAYIYQEQIVMFPMFGNAICIFDIKTSIFNCDSSWKQKEWKINGDFIQGCQLEDDMYVSTLTNGFILKYNVINKNHNLIEFPKIKKGIVKTIVYNSRELLLLSWIGDVWKYNVVSGESKVLYKYNGNRDCPYSNLVVYKKKIYLFPAHEEKIQVLLNENKYVLSYPIGWKVTINANGIDWRIIDYGIENNSILLYPANGNMLIILNTETDELQGIKLNEKVCWEAFFITINRYNDLKEQEQEKIGSIIWKKLAL